MSKANEISDAANPLPTAVVVAGILRNQLLGLAATGYDSFLSHSSSPEVQRRVTALREIQIKHDEFEIEYIVEKAALEAKYMKFYEPLYAKRYEIVTGGIEVEGDDNGAETMAVDRDEDKGVPAFWLVAMKNNKLLAEEISERDEAALAFLADIHWSRVEPESFKIDFLFESTNPFFSNPVLTKTYHMVGEDVLVKTSSSVIDWFPGKSLTENTTRRKPAKKAADLSAKNKEPVSDEECMFSFFNFFSPLKVDKLDGDAAEEVKQLMRRDYGVGITLRDKIIPHAVYWYTGEAVEDEFLNYGSADEEFEENNEDEDEDEDEG